MTIRPRRLVILWDYYQHYHFARLRALQSLAAERGWTVTGLAAGRGGAGRDSHAIKADAGPNGPIYLGGAGDDVYSPRAAARVGKIFDELQPEVVIFPGYGSRVARASLRWCRRNRRGAVMIFESQEQDFARSWLKEWIKRLLVRSASCAFCGGRSHAAYAAKLGMPPERIFYKYSTVDNDFWRSAAEAARQSPPVLSPPYFLAAGRFIPKKNFPGLVAAFARFKQTDNAGWRLVMVGDGPDRAAIVAEIERRQVSAWVTLPGYASALETARWMGHAAAFVMPSLREEQWGLVVNEAMAAGLPVVVSTVCGCTPDLVQDGVTGLTFDPANENQLVAALRRLAGDAPLRARLALAGREHIGRYSLRHFAEQALAACEKALEVVRSRS